MSRQPAVSRFRVRHGQGSASAPNLLSVADVPQRPPLYLLVETGGDDQLASTITFAADDAYRHARGSLTGALQAVVRAAGNALQKSPHAQGGLSALVVQKDEALLAQVEPAVCWLLRDGQLMRWPVESVWLDAGTAGNTLRHMTGGLGKSEADLSRITLNAGDQLLLGTTSLARDVGELLIAEAMAESDPGVALHRLAPDVDFAAMGIQPFGGAVGHPAALRPAPSASITVPAPAPAKPPAPAVQPLRSQAVPAPPPAGAAPVAPAAPAAATTSPARVSRSGLTFATPRRAATEAPRREFHLPSIDLRPYLEVVALAMLFLFKALGVLARGVWAIMKRALPDRESVAPRPTPSVRKPTFNSNPFENTSLRIVAFAIPVLLAIGVALLISRSSAENAARYEDLIRQADGAYRAALAGADGTARRAGLEKASRFIDDALKLQASDGSLRDSRAKDLQALVGKELDGLNKATTFFYYPLLYDFAEAGSRPSVLAARGNEVYVLDSGLHRLYKFLLNETRDQLQPAPTRMPTPAPTPNPVVMRQGDERGAIVVGELSDIFWSTAGAGRTSTGLLTLTAQKQVVEYVPSRGINVLAVAAAPGWEEATLGESFNGNLYVLDAKTNRILKFTPTGEDFKTPPVDYVSPGARVDFGGATGMAVDGFVWVLLADGTIMKFDGGNPVTFDKRGLDTPLKKTVAIVAQQNSPTLWVADAGNRRIVQFNKTGEYVRQYKPDDPRVMSDLRGFTVDETAQRFYWLNGTRLYLGTLQN